jgi:hypothetical protein
MEIIDYSKYSYDELKDAESRIDSVAHPKNYKALQLEIESRGCDSEIRKEQAKIDEQTIFSVAEERVKIVGYFQLVAALGISGVFVYSYVINTETDYLSLTVGIFFVALNLFAGYTAIKEQYRFYWVSILNQALQVPTFVIGTLMVNYSGLGGVYLVSYWGGGFGLTISASLEPGFSFYQLSEAVVSNRFAIDLVAIVFIGALVTVKKAKTKE